MSRINVANFRHPDGTSDNISLDSSGRVGIGTSAPATLLEIASNATNQTLPGIPTLRITNTDTTAVANDNVGSVEFFSKDASDPDVVTGFVRNIATSAGTIYDLTFGTKDVSIGSDATEKVRITGAGDFKFNSGFGSVATAYGVRAWIHFQGTGAVSINAHGNISGLTDEGTGEYTISFTTAMPDGNYATAGSAKYQSATNRHVFCAGGSNGEDPATGSLRFQTVYIDNHGQQDCEQVTVIVVR